MKKIMTNSGDVDADYTCPSRIRAFDVRCIFVGGVVRLGQEKQRGRSDTQRIPGPVVRSNTATYLPPPQKQTCATQFVACVCCATKTLLGWLKIPCGVSRLALRLTRSAQRLGDLL